MTHGGDIYNNKIDIDFSVNLNPVKPDADLKDAVFTGLLKSANYPDPSQKRLKENLSKIECVSENNLLFGNGASELILSCIRMINPKRVLLPVPCFTGYLHALGSIPGCVTDYYELKEANGFLLTDDIINALAEEHDLLILTNPGNPTGRNIDGKLLGSILNVAEEKNIKVILDESFLFLSKAGLSEDKIGIRKNVFRIRSFTKLFSLPGIRMGYVLAEEESIKELKGYLPEWNISAINEEVILSLLPYYNRDFIKKSYGHIEIERKRFAALLSQLVEKVYPSDSLYIMFKAETDLYEKLLKKGILIRDLSDVPGLSLGYFRVAVRKREENEAFIERCHSDGGA
ncbi:MAG: aminotransferase class I/II-fold pyridoxal phosphate-dependent enzyme [Lachnospiraceae bacterium]|nr:aminotransferase class I/II-fold pyridoxal phosphate-dependent enzyme [Lachnospiraceae bacterium]